MEITASDGKTYKTKYYNLDAIISVGYRVNASQATHFRIWATECLKAYIIKGFTMDDERLKNPNHAELQANNGNIMNMKNWVQKSDSFLQFNEQDIFHQRQLQGYERDFDKLTKTLIKNSLRKIIFLWCYQIQFQYTDAWI